MLGLYIHIPFCKSICHYCDFAKTIPRNQKVVDKYLDKLIEEIKMHQESFNKINTIYIGGGTPNYLNDESLTRLLKVLEPIKPTEFTIEINPELYTESQGQILKKYGVNRVSIGVQTFNQEILDYLNRKHTEKDVIKAVSGLKKNGIENVSIDLIFAIPNQTINDIKYDLLKAHELGVKHISYYSLILEENTYFYYLYNRQKFTEVSEDLSREMYEFIIKNIAEMGYDHYEISNFSKPEYESIHNKIYWNFDDYIGVGLAASGFIDGIRYYNDKSLNKYLKKALLEKVELTKEDKISEEIIMKLRLKVGINVSEFNKKHEIDIYKTFPKIKEMIDLKLLTEENGYLKLTTEGLFLGNQVFQIFI